MLSVAFVAALVTGIVISSTEEKVRETYSRLAEERFEVQVNEFLEERKARLESQGVELEQQVSSETVRSFFAKGDFTKKALLDLGNSLASEESASRYGIKARILGDQPGKSFGKKPLLGELRGLGGLGGPGGPGGRQQKVLLVDGKGRLHPMGGMKLSKGQAIQQALREFSEVGRVEVSQVEYLVTETDEGDSQLIEVLAAPVRAKEGGEVLGAVLKGLVVNSSKKSMERRGGKKGPSLGGEALLAGRVAEGEVFFDVISEELKELIRSEVTEFMLTGEDQLQEEVVLRHDGASYRLFYKRMNPGGTLPPAYQVVLYPLAQLKSDLLSLRLKGSGVGVGAMWIGVFLAWLLARRFAKPIREMAAATKEIRAGNYEVSVPVRSKDEVGDLAKSFNEMAGELKTKEQIRDVLGKVADEAVAEALISGSLELGGETRTVSILFCDIRGFTGLSETMEPTDVIELLNDHMTAMTRIVYEHRGVVDKFVGDEVMAVFGAPKTYGDDAENAALCALKMLEERDRLNRGAERPFEVGIGVATGSVVVGCIGSMDRLNYTVIGERVNRAARLSGLAGPGQAVIDEVTWQALADQARGTEIENVNLRGYAGDVRAFLLESAEEKAGQVARG